MSTITYNPLTGVTSKSDAANMGTFYEYDALGRLQCIRDIDRNILKAFDYKYKVDPTTN
jgi:YD repeat-containing protein